MRMANSNNQQICRCRCNAPVPAELKPVGLCVSHFTLSVERTCDEMHRQIALRQADVERQAEVATYMGECALLLARVASNLRSEEHTSELQSLTNLVCRLLLEKKKKNTNK